MKEKEQTRVPPETIELLRFGKNIYTVDGKGNEVDFTPSDAEKVIGEFSDRKRDCVIDYEHQTLSGNTAPAAGWIDRLEKTASGLTAHVKYWTDKGDKVDFTQEDAEKVIGEFSFHASPTLPEKYKKTGRNTG